MPACDVSIEFDDKSRGFRPGEPIQGRVVVRCETACKCDALTLGFGWKTHGRGNEASGHDSHDVLFAGEWEPGTHAYPFRLEAPDGPLTYRGRALNVDWYVEARADVPWAIDPKASMDVLLVPWTDADVASQDAQQRAARPQENYWHGPEVKTAIREQRDRKASVRSAGIGGVLLFVAAALCAPIAPFELTFVFALGGAILGGFWLYHWLTGRSLGGTPVVSLDKAQVEAGDSVRVQIAFTPPRDTVIERATARLQCTEIVVRGSGTDKRTFREEIHAEAMELATPGAHLPRLAPVQWSAQFRIPDDAPFSFSARDNQLRWSVALTIDTEGAPAWKEDAPFVVRPRRVVSARSSA